MSGHVDQGDVAFFHTIGFEAFEQQEVADKPQFDTHFFAFEFGDFANAWSANDHVVAVGIVVDQDAFAGFACGTCDQGIPIGHAHGIYFAGGKGVHGRHIFKPDKFHIDAGFFEPTLLDANFPSDPTRPVAVANFEFGGQRGRGKKQGERAPDNEK